MRGREVDVSGGLRECKYENIFLKIFYIKINGALKKKN